VILYYYIHMWFSTITYTCDSLLLHTYVILYYYIPMWFSTITYTCDSLLLHTHVILYYYIHKLIRWLLSTDTCFIQKIYAPSSSLLQGKHLPFSPSPLRLNIFRLFVILSLTQLYRYTYFSFRLPHLNIQMYLPGPPQTNWTKIFSESSLFYF
jgi:hypothetical protein